MTKRQKDILNLIRTIHKKRTWYQANFSDWLHRSVWLPCGTNCCLAGHLVNQFGTAKDKIEAYKTYVPVSDVAAKIIKRSFKTVRVCGFDGSDFIILGDKFTPWNGNNGAKDFAQFADALEKSLEKEN